MTTWYKTDMWNRAVIESVEVVNSTEKTVTIKCPIGYGYGYKEKRTNIHSRYNNYFPTWEDAQAYLIENSEQNVKSLRLQLERANGLHGNIIGMKKP